MRNLRLKRLWLLCAAMLICFAAVYITLNAADRANIVSGGVNDAEVRSRLLMEAMDYVGVCDATDAAGVWASGLKQRSAALQYSVMDAVLKAEYAKQLETAAPNWVTGMSSPWVKSYSIIDIQTPDENTSIIRIVFSTATSTGVAGDYEAVLTLTRQEPFWRITGIDADEGLYPYTRLEM
ncbi:MAG: hypothetical protein ACOYJD_04280 [Christensenellales bacterium]|jgi:hypothetical protein